MDFKKTDNNLQFLILVIEDDKYMNETLSEVLKSEGYGVDSALTVSEGLSFINDTGKKYQLLILDYNFHRLDGVTGIDFFNIAKEKVPKVNGIMISAYGSNKTKVKARDSGIRYFFDKPFMITDLIEAIDHLKAYPNGENIIGRGLNSTIN